MTSENVFRTVTRYAAGVLGETPEQIAAQPQLDQYPAFSSFVMADLVEQLEERYGIVCDPEELTPANLRDAHRLTALVEGALVTGGRR
ncbi:acyl carrier protein [Streptomyces sp. NPDC088812]|uniref:acyl carrier protein n=1 Tax=Streptomyces sp. NPDC088812 TaxID=3365905 RepID=UPI0037FDDCD5